MGKTLELREIITSLLNQSNGKTYYEISSPSAQYPYKVFEFNEIDLEDRERDDVILVVDVWSKDTKEVDNIADDIESLLNGINKPQGNSLPTFYRISRTPVPDEDKSIKHRLLKFQIQNYYYER